MRSQTKARHMQPLSAHHGLTRSDKGISTSGHSGAAGAVTRLVHYAHSPISELYNETPSDHPGWKPNGLWLSVEGGDPCWREWCESNNFNRGKILYEVRLQPVAKILRLQTADSVLKFGKRMSAWPRLLPDVMRDYTQYINWKRVARRYDGIIISPYQWSLRHDKRCFWYNPWDCASGCVWNAADCVMLKRVEE